MKRALVRMGADLRVASEQARRLERLVEQEPPERARGASDVRDGTSPAPEPRERRFSRPAPR